MTHAAATYHFEVMFRPELYHRDAEELLAAKAFTAALLYQADQVSDEALRSGIAAWAGMARTVRCTTQTLEDKWPTPRLWC